jgi:hypothetical protein
MAGNLSLEGSIRTCKIDTAYANKIFSDRFLNPGNMVCVQPTLYGSDGRPGCPDSLYTKAAGCNSAEDRVFVENYQRPRYVEYVNLSAGGIDGEFYGTPNTMTQWDQAKAVSDLQAMNGISGNFGMQFGANVFPNCGVKQYTRAMDQDYGPGYAFSDAMSKNSETLRKYSALDLGYSSNAHKMYSGF